MKTQKTVLKGQTVFFISVGWIGYPVCACVGAQADMVTYRPGFNMSMPV